MGAEKEEAVVRMRGRRCCKAPCVIAFGIGLMISCFCPSGLLFFLISAILVWLGFCLLRR